MAENLSMALAELLRKADAEPDLDTLREGVRVLTQALMELEVAQHLGAARYQRSPETVPAPDKLVSLFEPHTAVIRRGKLPTPTEFGRKVQLDEVDGGRVTRCAI